MGFDEEDVRGATIIMHFADIYLEFPSGSSPRVKP
jgi:hypothetical protein